ncbi:MAG TPA: cell envelope integrity protein CreD [Chitinophagaceae bacterium]|nr:cell envelope integrity protein CreD [Chitinophagaceae bacterium]
MEIVETIWQKSKLLIKGMIIGVLILLLMIPSHFVQELVQERESRQIEAINEVSSKWASSQNIVGPVLVIPYEETVKTIKGEQAIVRHNAYFLPELLDINAQVNPEERHRGIYQVMLYSSKVELKGKFSKLPLEKMKLNAADLLWNEAYVCTGISDAKGLNEEIQLSWRDSVVNMNPNMVNNSIMKEGFSTPVLINENLAGGDISFSIKINLNGSQQLFFTPVGKETSVLLEATWPDPRFAGTQLPAKTVIRKDGFTANWKSLSHSRSFPQQWKDDSYNLSSASFGADLFIPVNDYQKTLRSVKYAILCILLTFTAFFLIETTNRISVHPFQYALIGFALILFYTLLLSISEYTEFNTAYGIAAIATVVLITWFVKGLLGSMKLSALLSFVLVLLYSYVFTILQLQDYALLLGSIGLFLTLAIVMNFSKKIKW